MCVLYPNRGSRRVGIIFFWLSWHAPKHWMSAQFGVQRQRNRGGSCGGKADSVLGNCTEGIDVHRWAAYIFWGRHELSRGCLPEDGLGSRQWEWWLGRDVVAGDMVFRNFT